MSSILSAVAVAPFSFLALRLVQFLKPVPGGMEPLERKK